jgi:hypothetical protein
MISIKNKGQYEKNDILFGKMLISGVDKGGLVSGCTAHLHKVLDTRACVCAATSGNLDQGDLLMGLSSSSTCLSSAALQASGYWSAPDRPPNLSSVFIPFPTQQ